jgi:hypothetical protein
MEKILVVLCIAALSLTAVDGYMEMTGEDPFGFKEDQQNGNEEYSDIETVTVPENMLGELLHYDHFIHLEFFFENRTSGEWSLWILDYSGSWIEQRYNTVSKPDGFGATHSVLHMERDMNGLFTLFADSDDGEPITSDGEIMVNREEFIDLWDETLLVTENDAYLEVEPLQSTNVPLAFDAYMKSYFDPWTEKVETLEQSIYERGQEVTLEDTGSYTDETSWNDVDYDWVAQRGLKISGFDTIYINISSDLGSDDFSIPFKQDIWISNELPNFVKNYIRTNTSWDDGEEAGYILLENDWTLIDSEDPLDAYQPGTEAIPWGECTGEHWRSEHADGEYQTWNGNFMPKGGANLEESSFDFVPEDLINYLEVEHPSDELEQYLSDHPDAMIIDARYNASKTYPLNPDNPEGEFWWNITFGEKHEGSGWGSREEKRYRVLVWQETVPAFPFNPQNPEYDDRWNLEVDYGVLRGTSPLWPYEIESQTLTLASSEVILKTEPKIIENFYPNDNIYDELDWVDGVETTYSLGASSGEQGFGMDLIYTLTGIQTQVWSKYSWTVEKEDLMSGGTMATGTVDAETGRLVAILEIDGTALAGALNW